MKNLLLCGHIKAFKFGNFLFSFGRLYLRILLKFLPQVQHNNNVVVLKTTKQLLFFFIILITNLLFSGAAIAVVIIVS